MTDTSPALRNQLLRGARDMGVALGDSQCDQLLAYIREFHKWNQAICSTV